MQLHKLFAYILMALGNESATGVAVQVFERYFHGADTAALFPSCLHTDTLAEMAQGLKRQAKA